MSSGMGTGSSGGSGILGGIQAGINQSQQNKANPQYSSSTGNPAPNPSVLMAVLHGLRSQPGQPQQQAQPQQPQDPAVSGLTPPWMRQQ